MTNELETVREVLDEMRAWTAEAHDDPCETAINVSAFADRIEAAYRREMDEAEVLANSPTDFIFIDDPQTEVITEESNAEKEGGAE